VIVGEEREFRSEFNCPFFSFLSTRFLTEVEQVAELTELSVEEVRKLITGNQ
jgi:hypothetical protein